MDEFNQHKISPHRRPTRSWIIIISVVLLAHLIFFLMFKTEYLRVFERKLTGSGSYPSTSFIETGDRFELVDTGEGERADKAEEREEPELADQSGDPISLEYGEPPTGLPSLESLLDNPSSSSNGSSGEGAVIRPKPLFISWPSYPEELDRKYQGQVKLELLVNEKGGVDEVRLLKGLPSNLLNRKAIASAREIRFVPGKKNGRNSPMWVQISIGFKQK
ncbi:MAG: TonB family protein [Candidatus Latescibacteria bacterium]|nr:TonB family protein [bacterium]MBD3424394.1 TonB family protein [Candidatus Latescibacterota bacterium]